MLIYNPLLLMIGPFVERVMSMLIVTPLMQAGGLIMINGGKISRIIRLSRGGIGCSVCIR